MEVGDGLRRDLLELKRQVEAAARVPASASEPHPLVRSTPVQSTVHAQEGSALVVSVAPTAQKPVEPAASTPAAVEKAAEFVAAKQKQDTAPPVVAPHLPPTPDQLPEKSAPAAPSIVERGAEKRVSPPIVEQPTAATPRPESKQTAPVTPTSVIPTPTPEPTRPPSAATPPPLSRTQMPPTKTPAHASPTPVPPPPVAPPPPTARVGAPPQHATFRSSALASAASGSSVPAATAQRRMKSVFALEEILGRNWLNKIGIVLIVLGVAWFGIKEFAQLGAIGKSRAFLPSLFCASRGRSFSGEARALPGLLLPLHRWRMVPPLLDHVRPESRGRDAGGEFRRHGSRLHAPGRAGHGCTYIALPLAGGHRDRIPVGLLDRVAQQ